MTQQLTGLTAIAGFQTNVNTDPQASPEQRYGGTVDPRHGKRGEQAKPYPWEAVQTGPHGPYGPENQMLDNPDDWLFYPAGHVADDPAFDRTPSTGAAPWPKGIMSGPIGGHTPDQVAEMRRQSAEIHATNMGASLKMITGLPPVQDDWAELWNVTPGHSEQVKIPAQIATASGGFGTTDRTQSMARQNEYGFDSAHLHRRVATGAIPGNRMWMRPGGRPLRKTLAGPARPAIGIDSPFSGQDLGLAFSPDGAVLQNTPPAYTPPPNPTLGQPVTSDAGNGSVVEWY